MKYCTKCKVVHPITAFNRDRRHVSGYMSYCREAGRILYADYFARSGAEKRRLRYLKSRTSKRPYLRYHSKYNPRPNE